MRLRRHIVAAAPVAAAMVALCAIAAAAAPLASPAYTPTAGPWTLAPGEYYTELYGSAFATESAFNDDSKRADIGTRVDERGFRSYTELGWKKHLSAQFWMPFANYGYRSGALSGSSTSLGDFGLGLRWKLANGARAAALQFRWEAPAGYNRKLINPAGDGLQKLSASLQLGGPAGKRGFWQLGAGYRYDYLAIAERKSGSIEAAPGGYVPGDHDWSDHATVNAAYGRWFGNLMVAGIYGADLPVSTGRPYEVAAHVAGPRVTYRVDERLDAFAGSWHTPAGRNTWHADAYYAGVAWKLTKLNRIQGFLGSDKRP